MDNEKYSILLECEFKDIWKIMIDEGMKLSELPVNVLIYMKNANLAAWFADMVMDEVGNRIR